MFFHLGSWSLTFSCNLGGSFSVLTVIPRTWQGISLFPLTTMRTHTPWLVRYLSDGQAQRPGQDQSNTSTWAGVMDPYPAIKFNSLISLQQTHREHWVYSRKGFSFGCREFITSFSFPCYSCVISVFFFCGSEFLCSCLPDLEPWAAFHNRGMGTLPQVRQFQKSDLVYGRSPRSRLPGSRPKELWVMDYIQIAHVFRPVAG